MKLISLTLLLGSLACSGAKALDDVDATPASSLVPDAAPPPVAHLVINEAAAAGMPTDWVEIANLGDAPALLDGYHVSDDPLKPTKGVFPAGSTVPAGGYFLQEVSDTTVGFKLASDEGVWLYGPDDALLDACDWAKGQSPSGGSFARIPDGTGDFTTVMTPTPGAQNHD